MKQRLRRAGLLLAAAALTMAAETSLADPGPLKPQKSYYLPMSDGTRIALSLYYPEGKVPVRPTSTLLVQTRYGREGEMAMMSGLEKDYVVAIIDTRGSTSSFGPRDVDIGPDEVSDMEKVVAHLARQPWSDGKVYAYGLSYMADTADIATSRPAPQLPGAIIREVDFDTYLDLFVPGGVPNDWFLQSWGGATKAMDEGTSPDPSTPLDCRAHVEDCSKLWPVLAPVDEDKDFTLLRQALAGRKRWLPDDYSDAVFHDAKGRNGYSLFESAPAFRLDGIRRQAKPAMVWGSWMDSGTAEAALARYRSAPKVPMDIWIAANDHTWRTFADPFFPTDKQPLLSVADQHRIQADFLDRLSRGQPIERRIHYFVLGTKQFKETPVWPPRGVSEHVMYFGAGQRLSANKPAVGRDSYAVDFTANTGTATRWSTQFDNDPAYPDRRDEDRKLLVYDSAPVKSDQELAGYPILDLRVASQSTDPAFFAYLEDVAPNGRVTYLTEGEFRAIHRAPANPATLPYDMGPAPHSFRKADALAVVPGQTMRVRFALFPVAARIRTGHRLRIAIAGIDKCCFRVLSDGGKDTYLVSRGGKNASSIAVPLKPWSDR